MIRSGREGHCLPYAGFFSFFFKSTKLLHNITKLFSDQLYHNHLANKDLKYCCIKTGEQIESDSKKKNCTTHSGTKGLILESPCICFREANKEAILEKFFKDT